MKYFLSLLIQTLIWIPSHGQQINMEVNSKNMESEFLTPPKSASTGTFWCWLNGNMSFKSITRDLEAMKAKGIDRAEIWDVGALRNPSFIPAGETFLGDQSVQLIKFAFAEGKRLNMRIGLYGSSGWNAGGSWVTPDWASKSLFFTEIEAEGGTQQTLDIPFPKFPEGCPMKDKSTPVFYKDIAVLALPRTTSKTIDYLNQVTDLTPNFKDGKLTWKIPAGKWTIIRFVCSNNGQQLIAPSPNSKGLFIDFFDPRSTKRYLKYFMERLGVTPENSSETGPAYFFFDSMELKEGTPWTDNFARIFKERRGYNLLKYLPVFAGWKIKDKTERFLYDFRQAVSDQLIESHYKTAADFLKIYHADLVAEGGGPGAPIWNTCPVDALKALGSIPIPRGEFWIKHRNMFLIKEIASASHIYGKKIVDAESFTTWRRWKDSPFEMKKYVDRAFCEGLNNVTYVSFASTNPEDGLPGRTFHAGADINPGTTWWEKARPFMEYLTRCSSILQQGLFVADVCYYYGDQTPNFFPLFHDVPEKPMLKGLGKGYDYDVVNTDVILNRMSVKNGRIILPDGMSYAVMVLPEQTHMPLRVLEKIEKLVQDGATILGPRPVTVPGLNNWQTENDLLNKIADRLWGEPQKDVVKKNIPQPSKVISGLSAEEVLNQKGIGKDFSFGGKSEIDYIHRTTSIGEVFFIRNYEDSAVTAMCQFRVKEKYPELWDASTGTISKVLHCTKEKEKIGLKIELPAHGSIFVVFNNENRVKLQAADGNDGIKIEKEIKGPWLVNFPPKWGAPPTAQFNKLVSWTESEDPGIKYFSGTATYINSFTIEKGKSYRTTKIDLGEVKDLAEVFVNGKSAGILWKTPFEIDISKLVKEGENRLKVEIVNLWVNRLTGDMLSDPKDRYCKTNHPYITKEVWPGGDEPYRIQTSGLLGPVRLLFAK